jgi:hypothetical protein
MCRSGATADIPGRPVCDAEDAAKIALYARPDLGIYPRAVDPRAKRCPIHLLCSSITTYEDSSQENRLYRHHASHFLTVIPSSESTAAPCK